MTRALKGSPCAAPVCCWCQPTRAENALGPARTLRSPPVEQRRECAVERPCVIYARIPRREGCDRWPRLFRLPLSTRSLVPRGGGGLAPELGGVAVGPRGLPMRSVLPGWALRRRWFGRLSYTPVPYRRHCSAAPVGTYGGDKSHHRPHSIRLRRSGRSGAGN